MIYPGNRNKIWLTEKNYRLLYLCVFVEKLIQNHLLATFKKHFKIVRKVFFFSAKEHNHRHFMRKSEEWDL